MASIGNSSQLRPTGGHGIRGEARCSFVMKNYGDPESTSTFCWLEGWSMMINHQFLRLRIKIPYRWAQKWHRRWEVSEKQPAERSSLEGTQYLDCFRTTNSPVMSKTVSCAQHNRLLTSYETARRCNHPLYYCGSFLWLLAESIAIKKDWLVFA